MDELEKILKNSYPKKISEVSEAKEIIKHRNALKKQLFREIDRLLDNFVENILLSRANISLKLSNKEKSRQERIKKRAQRELKEFLDSKKEDYIEKVEQKNIELGMLAVEMSMTGADPLANRGPIYSTSFKDSND